QLHLQLRHAAGPPCLYQQRDELPRQPFVLTRLLLEGLCPVQRRPQDRELQLPVVVSLPPGQRLVCRLQPGLGHRAAADLTGGARPVLSRAFAIDRGEDDVLAGAVRMVPRLPGVPKVPRTLELLELAG